jgi:hypothetical protein
MQHTCFIIPNIQKSPCCTVKPLDHRACHLCHSLIYSLKDLLFSFTQSYTTRLPILFSAMWSNGGTILCIKARCAPYRHVFSLITFLPLDGADKIPHMQKCQYKPIKPVWAQVKWEVTTKNKTWKDWPMRNLAR